MATLRGIRFEGLAEAGEGAGLVTTPSGGLATRSGAEVVRQSIMMLLTTIPGERVMRPDYGCPLQRIVFAPNDATTAGLAIHYVRQALVKFEKRAEILRLDALPGRADDGDGNVLNIELDYRVRATLETDRVTLAVDLGGGG